MSSDPGKTTRTIVYITVLVLALLHHDFWLWSDARPVLGFMPAGLAYHVLFSLVATAAWALVVRHAWPADVEETAAPAGQPGVEAGP